MFEFAKWLTKEIAIVAVGTLYGIACLDLSVVPGFVEYVRDPPFGSEWE